MFIPLFATLLFAHLLADFPLQTNWLFRLKSRSWVGLALHAAIHPLVTALLLQGGLAQWPLLLWLGVLHFVCDWGKGRVQRNTQAGLFLLDQAVHVSILALLAWCFADVRTLLPGWWLYPLLIGACIPAVRMFQRIVQMDTRQTFRRLTDPKASDTYRPFCLRWERYVNRIPLISPGSYALAPLPLPIARGQNLFPRTRRYTPFGSA